jgi:hypothetical protein
MRHSLILNFKKPDRFLQFGLILFLLFCSCQTDPVQYTGFFPTDKAEFESVWQYLKAFSIYQDRVPEDPFVFKRPEEMFDSIGDYFKGRLYTCYYDGEYSTQAVSERYNGADIVSFKMVAEKTGMMWITTFYDDNVYEQFLSCVNKIPISCKNLIIDLRQNRGGYIREAVSVIEAFLPRGTAYIWAAERNLKYGSEAATIIGPWYTGGERHPVLARMENLIVWMDGETASASEILAVALKDCASARLVGSRSSGKGIGQVILRRNGRPGLQITYLQLSGKPGSTGVYHEIGLAPDVEIDGSSEDEKLASVVHLLEPKYTGEINNPRALSFQKASVPACIKIIYEDSLLNPVH